MSPTTTVYIELLDEGTEVWRPVDAEYLGGNLYRLIGDKPDDEVWAFAIGDVVKCEDRELSGGKRLVAYEKSS